MKNETSSSIDIICPLYNASEFILNLHESLKMQKKVNIKNIFYILTESKDDTESILKSHDIAFQKIKKQEFSHSLTRETLAMQSTSDVIVFITQDIVIESDLWLYNLTKNIINGTCEAAYSRQVSKYNNLEKYTREKNYPDKSFSVTKKDIQNMGLKTFFFSDASSAIKTSIFKEVNGYDGKKLPISEDMYIAYKIIMNGYKINYEADSVVFHSHNFTLKELYERYKLTGQFMKENNYLDQYGTIKSGGGLAKYIIKRAIEEKNIKVLLRYPFDMAARLLGMISGKKK